MSNAITNEINNAVEYLAEKFDHIASRQRKNADRRIIIGHLSDIKNKWVMMNGLACIGNMSLNEFLNSELVIDKQFVLNVHPDEIKRVITSNINDVKASAVGDNQFNYKVTYQLLALPNIKNNTRLGFVNGKAYNVKFNKRTWKFEWSENNTIKDAPATTGSFLFNEDIFAMLHILAYDFNVNEMEFITEKNTPNASVYLGENSFAVTMLMVKASDKNTFYDDVFKDAIQQ